MDDPKARLVTEWRTKALHDLGAARLLAAAEHGRYLDAAAYHCQQAAEKILKALLCSCDAPIPKSHDLVALVNDCAQYRPALKELIPSAALLAPLATLYRYPGAGEPDSNEVRDALTAAESVVARVASVIDAKECPK